MLKVCATQAENGAVHPLVNCAVRPSVCKRSLWYPSEFVCRLDKCGSIIRFDNNSRLDFFLFATDKMAVSNNCCSCVLFRARISHYHYRKGVANCEHSDVNIGVVRFCLCLYDEVVGRKNFQRCYDSVKHIVLAIHCSYESHLSLI